MPGVGPLMCFQKLSRWLEAHSSLRSTLSGLDRAYSWISLSWAIELLSQMWVNLICSHFKNQYFTHFCNWLQSPNVLGLMIFRRGDWTSPAQQAVIAPQVSICVPCHLSPPPSPRPADRCSDPQDIHPKGYLPTAQDLEQWFSPMLHVKVTQRALETPMLRHQQCLELSRWFQCAEELERGEEVRSFQSRGPFPGAWGTTKWSWNGFVLLCYP